MNKIFALLISVVLIFSLAACGVPTDTDNETNSTEIVEQQSTVKWKEFLKEYEAWIDEYILFMNKYKENPADLSLLSDYADMATEITEWASKADEVQVELESSSPAEVAEYSAQLAKLAAKLAKAAY